MRNQRRIWPIGCIVAVLAGLMWLGLSSGPPDPVYAGRKLSSWLAIYYPDNQSRPGKNDADEAVRKLGTNAVPLLLHLLQKGNPSWKVKLFALLDKQHLIKINHTPPLYVNYAAAAGFMALGVNARAAVPALSDIYGRNISRDSQFYTATSLGAIGPPANEAVPVLMKGLTNTSTDPLARLASIQALGEIHADPERVVPLLIQILNGPNADDHSYAAAALGEFGARARPAVPALLKLLDDFDRRVSEKATAALKQIDPEAAAKAGVN